MSKKKKTYLTLAIVLFFMYLLVLFYFIHIRLVMTENPEMDVLTGMSEGLTDIFKQPFAIFPLPSGIGTFILITLVAAGFIGLIMWESTVNRSHYKNDEAQGSAKWLTEAEIVEHNKKVNEPFGQRETNGKNNMILSKDMFMSLDNMGIGKYNNHQSLNANVLVVGGSGAGKSFGLVGPNILQANCSMVITDPSGELYQNYGNFLERMGYKVKCFNLSHMEKSNHYNPFKYINNDKEIEILVNTLITNTTPPEKSGGDPFWEKAETALLNALIAYLFHYCEPKFQNFSNVMELIRAAEVKEEDETSKSPLDYLFEQLNEKVPDSFAYRSYKTFRIAAGRTLKSILVSVGVRLQQFDLEDMANLTNTDDIDLHLLGDEKTALFVIIPTGDDTFSFITSMMYSQLFQRLYDFVDNTAFYAQLVIDGDGEVVKTFRADSEEESETVAKKQAEKFIEKSKTASVEYNEETKLYHVKAKDGTILRFSNDEGMANKFLESLKRGHVQKNGKIMPIHVRLLLDEYRNTGRITGHPLILSTSRKYGVSSTIILQSIEQIEDMYEKEWNTMCNNCDNTIYLGGGADLKTAKWMSELMGKETRKIMSTNYNSGMQGGGSTGYQLQGVELYSVDRIREIPPDECIVLQKSLKPYKGPKFPATLHKNWKYIEGSKRFTYDAIKNEVLYKEFEKANRMNEEEEEKDIPKAVPESKEEEKERKKINEDEKKKAEEYKNNHDINRDKIVNSPVEIDPEIDAFAEEFLKVENEKEVAEVSESIIESNEIDLDDFEEMVFKSRTG